MKRVTINIGMGNNPYETKANDFADYFRVRFGAMCRYAIGKWEGANENTLVIYFETDEDVVDFTKKLCGWTNQTAIAVKVDGVGDLVYNEGHEGERYGFSDDYFIELYDGKYNVLSYHDESLLASGLSWHDAQVFCEEGKKYGGSFLIEKVEVTND